MLEEARQVRKLFSMEIELQLSILEPFDEARDRVVEIRPPVTDYRVVGRQGFFIDLSCRRLGGCG